MTIELMRAVVNEFDAAQKRADTLNSWFLAAFRDQVYQACLIMPEINRWIEARKSDAPPLWTLVSWAIRLGRITPFYGKAGTDFGVRSACGGVWSDKSAHIVEALTLPDEPKYLSLPKTDIQFFLGGQNETT